MLGLGNDILRDLEDSEMYLGDVRVSECYLGDELVYPVPQNRFGVVGTLRQDDDK